MTEIEKIGHLVRFGLAMKKIQLSEIRKWADYNIANGSEENLYFDLSIARSAHEVIEVLTKEVEWSYKNSEIRELILGFYKEYLKSENSKWRKVQKEVIDFYNYIDYDDSNERVEDFIYFLIDDYALRADGLKGSMKMPDYLIEKLSEFDTYPKLQELLRRNRIHGFEIP